MTRAALVKSATAAGLRIAQDGSRTIITRTGRGAASIIVTETSITRGDVRLDLAARITPMQAAKVLGL